MLFSTSKWLQTIWSTTPLWDLLTRYYLKHFSECELTSGNKSFSQKLYCLVNRPLGPTDKVLFKALLWECIDLSSGNKNFSQRLYCLVNTPLRPTDKVLFKYFSECVLTSDNKDFSQR